MNSSRKIDISKSSLVSLRAELARKQEEVIKAKAQSQAQFIRPIPKVKKETIFTKKNVGLETRAEKDFEERKEEEDELKKSRAALESKSKLYDELSKHSEQLDDDDGPKYLVDFQQKEWNSRNDPIPTKTFTPMPIANLVESDDEGHISDEGDIASDPEEDWVDYVDCLGRTRRCLRRDLPTMKEKDSALSGTVAHEPEQLDTTQIYEVCTDGDRELLSGDMRREIMRAKWEEQERHLQDRSDVHYQDVLFDEARSHGVAYYGFSGDEAARATQQAALNKLREDTRREQDSTRVARERRQKQLDARLKAARQRQRVKMGLPPEEDEPEPVANIGPEVPEPPEPSPEDKTRKDAPVRPWDIGKEGVNDTHVMSQEEWTKKRRRERDSEFAPPPEYSIPPPTHQSHKRSKPIRKKFTQDFEDLPLPTPVSFSQREDVPLPPPSAAPSSFSQRKDVPLPAPSAAPSSFSQRKDVPLPAPSVKPISFSLRKVTRKFTQEPTPIVDDLPHLAPSVMPVSFKIRKGAEIAPPPTFEYYGPASSTSSSKPAPASAAELESSIMAGLKFLRQQAEKKENTKEKGLFDIV